MVRRGSFYNHHETLFHRVKYTIRKMTGLDMGIKKEPEVSLVVE